jgi:ABC-2 type transport system ATP-binding protein
MIAPALCFQHVTKKFENIVALDSISIDVPPNSIFGLLGPNGSGKSTLMRILSGLIKTWDGNISISGEDYSSSTQGYINKLGFLIEAPSFYEYLSAIENLKILSRLTNLNNDKIKEALDVVNLTDRAYDKVKTFSYGMKQRLGLAQCLLHDPEMLILDEPNNGLDPSGIREMSKIINNLHKNGKTICVSTHILSEVDTLCTHAAILKKGKHIATVKLDDDYHADTTYLLTVDNASSCFKLLSTDKDFDLKLVDDNSLIVKTRVQDAVKVIRQKISKTDTVHSLSKQSNLIVYFDD